MNENQKVIIITGLKEQKHILVISGSVHFTPQCYFRAFSITKTCKMLTDIKVLLKRNPVAINLC